MGFSHPYVGLIGYFTKKTIMGIRAIVGIYNGTHIINYIYIIGLMSVRL